MNKLAIILVLIFSVMYLLFAQNHNKMVYSTSSGAIDGYDPVAYFKLGKAMKGKDQYTFEWKGGIWHFLNEDNKSIFMKNPEKYAPEYGGYCAYGMAEGYKAKIDPKAWAIEKNKLYLNYDQNVQKSWMGDKEELIKKADRNWIKIRDEP